MVVNWTLRGMIAGITALISPLSLNCHAGTMTFPPGTVANVETYGAHGNDEVDDTPAIQLAISQNIANTTNRIVYFPAGTYLISNSLMWKYPNGSFTNGLSLVGENQATTIIKLTETCQGFSTPSSPKAMIFTASQPTSFNGTYASNPQTGEGNSAFNNHIVNLTLNSGRNHSGAIGIDFLGNNLGGIRDVTILSEDGAGVAGISMIRSHPGPSLFKNIQIEGFDIGIRTGLDQLSLVFEHIVLKNQRVVGISNEHNTLAIRDLVSQNSVPVIKNGPPSGSVGMISLLDGKFTGNPGVAGILNYGFLFVRNLFATNYQFAIKDNSTTVFSPNLTEAALGDGTLGQDPVKRLFPTSRRSLNLKIEETPEYFDNEHGHWANVLDYGVIPNDNPDLDDMPGINAALASGKSTIYFPPGEYRINGTLRVLGNAKHVIGISARIWPTESGTFFNDALNPKPMFKVEATNNTVHIENFELGDWDLDHTDPDKHSGLVFIEHASPQPLILKRLKMFEQGGAGYRYSGSNPGKVFIEDIAYLSHDAVGWWFGPKQQVWARQFNLEGLGTKIVNQGADLWILGLKTENHCTVIETKQGGRTELFGGYLYPVHNSVSPTLPAFINHESSVSLNYIHQALPGSYYSLHVSETRGGLTRSLLRDDVFGRYGGAFVPLYVGYKKSKAARIPYLSRMK